ncbi:NAD/NADP-dependent octopine/nopaline dehydrogenase family protein [Variovorax sp. OV329]|uniref:NAD/NADP-dependent octopine/nopaline dehydrogenase family protein n=1 Tax=Variovorax sp. OV329 TaxID=1882825 RepID=UPI0008EE1078|nr:NAD/NADP-dependent octopine/nopaline dehydrogenase family protein [Variovorax sp. OV329]SFM21385.1 ketopantoate reductase [Variovorax sp. OV329]
MRVGILGAGAVGFGTAAFLAEKGHEPLIWSPSGDRTARFAQGARLVASGAIHGQFEVGVAESCHDAVCNAEMVLLALPGYAHRATLEAAAPHIRAGQPVIISSHMSFGALYLERLLEERGVRAPVIAWGTTLVTGSQPSSTEVKVVSVRGRIDLAAVPAASVGEALALCTRLFGDRFVAREGLLAIALSNLNPQNHLAIAMMNLTRMERGETWSQSENVTPAVGRLIEALDAERLAIARACGVSVKTVREHFSQSFHVPPGGVFEMNRQMFEQGNTAFGPRSADSRYVLEDVPFGLVATVELARLCGVPVPLHEAGVALFSAAYGRDFAHENDLLRALGFKAMGLAQLQQTARNGN